jgi:type III pantothenate kinase
MRLVLDVGNSALKWGLVDDRGVHDAGRVLHREVGIAAALASLPTGLADHPDIVGVNVAGPAAAISVEEWARGAVGWVQVSDAAAGVRNGYLQPRQLGVDRWVALIGARRLGAGPWVVVGCGTALTIDLLRADGEHLGGYIVPGLHAMRGMLGALTSGVQVGPVETSSAPARDTAGAVSAGSRRALSALISAARAEAPSDPAGPWRLLLTGGDAPALLNQLDGDVRHEPHLVLLGAAALMDHAAP